MRWHDVGDQDITWRIWQKITRLQTHLGRDFSTSTFLLLQDDYTDYNIFIYIYHIYIYIYIYMYISGLMFNMCELLLVALTLHSAYHPQRCIQSHGISVSKLMA